MELEYHVVIDVALRGFREDSVEEAIVDTTIVRGTLHRERLSTPGLSVGEKAAIESIQQRRRQRRHLLKDIRLCCSRTKHSIELILLVQQRRTTTITTITTNSDAVGRQLRR